MELGNPRLAVNHGPHAVIGDPSAFEQRALAGMPARTPAGIEQTQPAGDQLVASAIRDLTREVYRLRVAIATPWYVRMLQAFRDFFRSDAHGADH